MARARALLISPVDDREARAARRRLARKRTRDLDRGQHAEAAVEPAAFGDAVQMAAGDDRPGALARQHDPDVGRLVALDAQLGQLGCERLAQPLALVRPRLRP